MNNTNYFSNLLVERVNRWEEESIEKIKQTAQETRELLFGHTNENTIKAQLEHLTEQLRKSREEGEIIEEDLHKWKDELKQLTQHRILLFNKRKHHW